MGNRKEIKADAILPENKDYPAKVVLYKNTDDNWCGSFSLVEHGEWLVRVYFYNIKSTNVGFVRVSVWGNDDCGYEKDFNSKDIAEAWKLFLVLLTLPKINFKDVKELGFKHA